MTVEGPVRGILTAERTALNFLQRMSGIATLTRRFVERAGPSVAILDTRKTTPTLRVLEKYAVLCGGGQNHRFGLYDRCLIKDNHRRLWRKGGAARLDQAVREARRRFPDREVEVEVENEAELRSALKAGPEWVLLDNMTPAQMKRCVRICDGRVLIEASGGITLKNVAQVAATGVDAISLGCLTHSAPAADLSLEIV
jgi:nicotinate-nucleotide pyrophosphorylase (carboxylating)